VKSDAQQEEEEKYTECNGRPCDENYMKMQKNQFTKNENNHIKILVSEGRKKEIVRF
jgi:hypothetical protein